jgi:hypothetical protein
VQNLCTSLVAGRLINLTQVLYKIFHCQLCLHKCIVIGQELIPWSGVLSQKLTGPQLVKFPSVGDNCMFITTYTSASHLSLSWTDYAVHASPCHLLDNHSAGIFPSMPRSSKWFHSLRSPNQKTTHIFCLPYMPHAPPIWLLIWSWEYLLRCTEHQSYSKMCIKILLL